MKILVTGANGYLGQGIVKCLIDDGLNVVATDFSNDKVDERAVFLKSDIFSLENPYSFFDKPDILLHLAWKDGFIHNAPSHINDLPKHLNFISKMINGGVKKVVVMGTMHEIGFFEGSINENTPCNPQSMYGISKNALRRATELLCKEKNIKFQWLRGFYMVGNASSGSSIFSKIMKAEMAGEEFFPFTSGKNQWDFIDYNDFCHLTSLAVEQDDVLGIINICSGVPQKLSERVERFIKENKLKIKLDYGKFPDRPYDSKAVWGDNGKITEILKRSKR